MRKNNTLCLLTAGLMGLNNVLAAAVVSNSAPSAPFDQGLLACWPLNDGKGDTAADISTNGNNGHITSPCWVNVKSENMLFFVPGKGTMASGYVGTLDQGMTMSAWFFTSSTAEQTIVQRNGWENRILIGYGKLNATLKLFG
ncbi:MAG: hypothetical protein WC347_11950, partial [Smithellaceae bacterium]